MPTFQFVTDDPANPPQLLSVDGSGTDAVRAAADAAKSCHFRAGGQVLPVRKAGAAELQENGLYRVVVSNGKAEGKVFLKIGAAKPPKKVKTPCPKSDSPAPISKAVPRKNSAAVRSASSSARTGRKPK